MGTGGGKLPLIMTNPLTLKIRSGCEGGGKGPLIQNNMSATLSCGNDQTLFETNCYCISGNLIGRQDKNGPNGKGVISENSYTLNTSDRHSVAYSMTTGCYTEVHREQAATLMARDYKDPQVINQRGYFARRITPLECCRLQGFPDNWCFNLEISEPSDEDIKFWQDVFLEYGKTKKEKQITKWLKNPYSNSSQYKMWGNGVALPCVLFVMKNIRNQYENTS